MYHSALCTRHTAHGTLLRGQTGEQREREEVRAGARGDAGERQFQAPGRLGALSGLESVISEHVCTGYTLLINSADHRMDACASV